MSSVVTRGAEASEERLSALEAELSELRRRVERDAREDSVAIVCFSGEWDRLFATFSIANGALALGQEVHLFFTFWGACAARVTRTSPPTRRSFMHSLVGRMIPTGASRAPLSKMNFFGLGKLFMGRLMRRHNVDDLDTLVAEAREMGAKFHYCDTSLRLFGWDCDDLADRDASDLCGVSSFLRTAIRSKTVLFI